MSEFTRVLGGIEKNRQKRLDGSFNCIPWNLPEFEMYHPGIEQGKYYIITANSKVGKTQMSDHLFLYNTYDFVKSNKSNIKLKIFYFSLEMSKEEKIRQAISRKLFIEHGLIIDPQNLMSKYRNYILNEEVIDLIKSYQKYFEEFLDTVTFIDNIRNPYGIYSFVRDYAQAAGIQHKKKVTFDITLPNGDKATTTKEIDDYYQPHDPTEYVIVIVDHARLISPEKGKDQHTAISDLSSEYFLKMRDKWNYIPVLIQQQAAGQESIENAKFNRLHPTLDGLGTNKNTQQDANLILGLFSPYRHKLSHYPGRNNGYEIGRFKDHIRFLEILGGRDGGAGIIKALLFHGAVNYFEELPHYDNPKIKQYYKKVETWQK